MRKALVALMGSLVIAPTLLVAESFWVGVFSDKADYPVQTFIASNGSVQSYVLNEELYDEDGDFRRSIKGQWDKGFNLIDIAYGRE